MPSRVNFSNAWRLIGDTAMNPVDIVFGENYQLTVTC